MSRMMQALTTVETSKGKAAFVRMGPALSEQDAQDRTQAILGMTAKVLRAKGPLPSPGVKHKMQGGDDPSEVWVVNPERLAEGADVDGGWISIAEDAQAVIDALCELQAIAAFEDRKTGTLRIEATFLHTTAREDLERITTTATIRDGASPAASGTATLMPNAFHVAANLMVVATRATFSGEPEPTDRVVMAEVRIPGSGSATLDAIIRGEVPARRAAIMRGLRPRLESLGVGELADAIEGSASA